MRLFGRKKEPDPDEEHQKNVVYSDMQSPSGISEDMLHSLGRTSLLMTSDDVDSLLGQGLSEKAPATVALIPAFAGVNRTCKIMGKKDAKILLLKYRLIRLLFEAQMNEDDFNEKGWNFMEALDIYAHGIVADMVEGWKGNLITEQVKVIRTELKKEKKGWL